MPRLFLSRLFVRPERLSRKNCLRSLQLERLGQRQAFTVEGQAFDFSQNIDTSALGGTINGSFSWGDGTTSTAIVSSSPSSGPLSIRIDYSLDSSGFFSSQERRNSLQFVANSIISKFSDQLSAIRPTGIDQWTAKFLNPSTGADDTRINLVIPANEILIFAGARPLAAGELGRGEKGGFSATSNSQAFIDTVKGRGQTGALLSTPTDFGPWGGTVAFSSTANWHFGLTTDGLDSNEFDFVSVATHEILHSLGFGLANSWNAKVSGGFVGANSVAVYGSSPVPLNDISHWAVGTTSNGQTAAMTPETTGGQRKLPTRLDMAGMQDIGWQLIPQQVQVSGGHTFGDNGSFAGKLTLNGSVLGALSIPVSVNVTNVAPKLSAPSNQNAVQGISLALPRLGQFSDPGFGAPQASPPQAESFSYTINWGDGTAVETGTAIVESLGSAGVETKGFFGGNHVYALQGNYTATIAVIDDDGDSSQQQFTVLVGAPPSLELSIDRTNIAEDAGANAATLTLRRNGFDLSSPLTIQLVSSDTTELQLPSSISIPAGQTLTTIPVQAIDDTLLDGTIQVLLTASAGSIVSNAITVDVLDKENLLVTSNRTSFAENAGSGAATLTVSRSNSDISQTITVQLSSNDTSEASLPSSIVIPAGSTSTTVSVDAIDDALFDGTQTVIIIGTSAGYESGNTSFQVFDYQPLSLALQSNEVNEENAALRSTQVEVSIRSPAPSGGVTVQLVSSEPNQLTVPSTVQIAAGQSSASFAVSAIDDFVPQGRRTVRISASGADLIAAAVDIAITDNDPAYWTNPNNPFDVNNNGDVEPLDVLIIINEINLHGSRSLNPGLDRSLPFIDVNRNGEIDPLDVLLVINEINR